MAIKSTDQITIIDVTDAYSVILTSEAYTFVGNTSGAASGNTCSTQVVAFCGKEQCQTVSIGTVTCPTGITSSITNNNTASPTITFTTNATVSSACEAVIPVTVDGVVVNKKFSFAVAKTGATGAQGATGNGISKVETFYLTTNAGTGVTTSTSGWDTTPEATTTTNKYIWSYTKTTYTNGNSVSSTPAIIGTHGATGAQGGTGATGNGVSKVETFYLTTSSSSGVTTSTSGWSTTPTATTTTNKYIWSYQKVTFTNGTTNSSTPAIVGTHGATGATGAAGADAITLTITSSAGSVFKNSSGSTVLTAHVFKGGVEQTISDAGVVANSLGQIKWYKGTDTTAVATTKTLTVQASSVTNTETYTCQLE